MAYSGYQAMPMSFQYADVSKGHYSPPSAPSTPAMTPQPSPHPMPLPMPSPLLTSVSAPGTDSPASLPRGRGSWCKRFSHVNSSGAMCTSTAWAPEPQAKETIKLGPEMRQLYNLVTRTSTEMVAAEGARFTLQSILFSVWQDTTVKMCGSEVFRLGLPGAPLQVAAEHCGDVQQSLCALQERGLAVQPMQPGSSSVRVTVSGVEVDLAFEEGSSVARLRSRALKKLVDKFPDAPIIACVINTRLGQSRYDGLNQGFSPDATLAMVLHLCQRRQRDQEQEHQPQPTDDELEPGRTLAAQLLSFFDYYEKFDFKTFSIVADSPDPIQRPDAHSEAQVSVLCPVSGENIAHACVKLMRIQVMYQHCHQALAKYDGVPVGQKRGYKGRTPLATIVSIEPLWPRAREIGIAPPETKLNLPGSTPPSSGLSCSSISLPSPCAMPLPKPSIPIDLPDFALSP